MPAKKLGEDLRGEQGGWQRENPSPEQITEDGPGIHRARTPLATKAVLGFPAAMARWERCVTLRNYFRIILWRAMF